MRKHFRKYLPTRASIRENRQFSRLGAFLQHPNLWHLNRRSVAGGVAVGLFAGLVPGPLQMLAAALLAIPLRVNLPVAVVTTLYTNPLTIGPLYLLAYQLGKLIVGGDAVPNPAPGLDLSHFWHWTEAFAAWVYSLGKPLVAGLIALAFGLAALGWLAVWYGWRWYVAAAWRSRAAKRAAAKKPAR